MAIRTSNRSASRFSNSREGSQRRPPVRSRIGSVEVLEDRQLLSTFTVTNLNPAGAGSLRRAILESNAQAGVDRIGFQGQWHDPCGSNLAPRDHRHRDHRRFLGPFVCGITHGDRQFPRFPRGRSSRSGDGSTLQIPSRAGAGRRCGVTLRASHVTVEGNSIGLLADGTTAAGNRGDGVRIESSSRGNLIGRLDPVTSVTYANADAVSISRSPPGKASALPTRPAST